MIKNIIIFTIVFWSMFLFLRFMDKQDAKLMEINYCWDSNGEHYVAPNENCRN